MMRYRLIAFMALALLALPVHAADTATTTVRIPILVYHSVFPDHPGQTEEQRAYGITPDQLDAQLSYLEQNGYTAISMDEVFNAIQDGTTTTKLVAITFDDGWWNQYAYAFPLLVKHHMRATFFIYPNPIGKSELFMNWDQVRALSRAGMTIGSHSLTHPDFTTLTLDQMQTQVAASKEILETQLSVPIRLFASPYGYYSPELQSILEENGYVLNRTLGSISTASSSDLYNLKGFLMTRDMPHFEWAVKDAL